MYKQSILAAAVLAAAFGVQAAEQPLENFNLTTGEHTFTAAGTIEGGSFIRSADGIGSSEVTISTTGETVFDGSNIVSTGHPDYTAGVVVTRGDSIGLYYRTEPDSPDSTAAAFYTEDQVREIFSQGYDAVKEAFSTEDGYVPPESLTVDDVLKALEAAHNLADAGAMTTFDFQADGSLTFRDSTLSFDSVGVTNITTAGRLTFDNSSVTYTGGGATNTISANGIDILSGTFHTIGSVGDNVYASKFDDRNRFDRNRWTLGECLTISTTDGMNFGAEGSTVGPDVLFRDGMIIVQGSGDWNINSGTVTLDGQFRSTLISDYRTSGDLNITGGTINIISGDRINRVQGESASMLMTGRDLYISGDDTVVNLVNGQIYASAKTTISGGTINMTGDSAISSTTAGELAITGGNFNIDTRSFIGAIKGDSLDYSAYPTSQKTISITGGTFNFNVTAPTEGTNLVVGENIGGIHATAEDSVISVSDAKFEFVTGNLAEGTYTADDFISVAGDNGTLNVDATTSDTLFYKADIGTDGSLSFPLFIGRVSPIPSAAHKEADRLALFTANSERSGLAESDRGIEVELLIESFKTCIDAFRPDLGTHGPIAVAVHVDVGRAAQVHGGAFVGNTRDFRSHIVVDSGDRERIFIVAHTRHRDVERRVFGREDLAVGPSLKPHGFVRIGVVRVVIRALVRAREHINLDSRPVHVSRSVPQRRHQDARSGRRLPQHRRQQAGRHDECRRTR